VDTRVLRIGGPQPGQKTQQLLALVRVEVGTELFLDADGYFEGLVKELLAARGKRHHAGSAVGGVRTASDQPPALEFVNHGDHAVGVQVQAVSDSALALAIGHRERPQEPELPWLDAQWFKGLRKLGAHGEPYARHGERDARRRRRRVFLATGALPWHGAQPIPASHDSGRGDRMAPGHSAQSQRPAQPLAWRSASSSPRPINTLLMIIYVSLL
jgi:hypothetical protein